MKQNLCSLVPLAFLLLVVFGVEHSSALETAPVAAVKPFVWFGWYGYDPSAQAGWVSLGVTDIVSQLVQGKQLGIPRQFFSLEWTYLVSGTRDGKPALVLRSDWETVWEENTPLYSELLNNGTINGFFMGDELMWNGLSYEQLCQWSAKVRATFPGAWIWENEAVPVYGCAPGTTTCHDFAGRPINTTVIPPALSSTSIDLYDWNPNSNPGLVNGTRHYYDTYLKPRLSKKQSLFLVPGSASSNKNKLCNETCYDHMVARDAEEMFQWLKSDPLITGMVPWTWYSCGKGCDKFGDPIGTIDMNITKATWKRIGQEILAGQT